MNLCGCFTLSSSRVRVRAAFALISLSFCDSLHVINLSVWQHPPKQEWLSNVWPDVLSGLVVALALIPESIAFFILVGVDPKVGLYASFCMAVVAALAGGRPGMISAATGAMALILLSLVKAHGMAYMFAATILTGVMQIVFGWRKFGRYMKFVPRAVMVGFVNALGIFIFMAQLPQFSGASWHMYAMVAASLLIIYGFPYITKAVPSPLVAIISMTVVSVVLQLPLRTVGDMGDLPSSLPFSACRKCRSTFKHCESFPPTR
jgi:SulP family sulfate permease